MYFQIIAVGNKMPQWVTTAFLEYHKRFPREYSITLTEIPLKKATQQLLTWFNPKNMIVVLDEKGEQWNTEGLSQKIIKWQNHTSTVHFIIGGPDGLPSECLAKANIRWSLSQLTLPHPMVRVILIEQLYRAITLLNNHPYHRP